MAFRWLVFIVVVLFTGCSANVGGSQISGSTGNSTTIADEILDAEPGEVVTISWQVESDQGSTVSIEFSTDAGQTWQLVQADVPNSGSYNYTLPTDLGTEITLRVLDANGKLITYSETYRIVSPVPTPDPSPTPLQTSSPITFDSIGGFYKAFSGYSTQQSASGWFSALEGMVQSTNVIRINPADNLIYVLTGNSVQRFHLDSGIYIDNLGYAGSSISSDGSDEGACVIDAANGWCTGAYMWSDSGEGGIRATARGMNIDTTSRKIYVSDHSHRIQRFNMDTGTYEGSIGAISGGYVTTTNRIDNPQNFTLSAWFKTTSTKGGAIIGMQSYQTYTSSNSYDRHIYMQPTGELVFGVWNGSARVAVSPLTYNDGNWHHVVGTFEADSVKLYVDGVEVAEQTVGVSQAQDYSGYWWIGHNRQTGWPGAGKSRYFDASFDNIGVWEVVLTPAEVASLHATPVLSPSSPQWGNIHSAWNFDETSGETLLDISGNENHGTIHDNLLVGVAGVSGGTGIQSVTVSGMSGWTTGANTTWSNVDGTFRTPQGIGIDVAGDVMLVADMDNHRVQKFVLSTGTFVGAIGNLSSSTGTCPGSGAASGWCTGGVFASGSGDGMFNKPYRVTVDAASDVFYVPDLKNHRISKFQLSTGAYIGSVGKLSSSGAGTCVGTGATSGWCTGGVFSSGNGDGEYGQPTAITLDKDNDLAFVSDHDNDRIVKVDLSTGAFLGATGLVATAGGSCSSAGVDNGWCAGGVFGPSPTGENGSYNEPHGTALHNGFLFVGNQNLRRVERINVTTGLFNSHIGGVERLHGLGWTVPTSMLGIQYSSNPGALDYPYAMASDIQNKKLIVLDTYNGRVAKYNLETGVLEGYLGKFSASEGTCPIGIAPGWCTGGWGQGTAEDGGFDEPLGVALDVENDLMYIASYGDGRLSKFQYSTGAFIGSIGNITSSSAGTCPASGAAPGWCTGGEFTEGSGDGMFDGPGNLALDVENDVLWIADAKNHRVTKVVASTGSYIGSFGNTSASTGSCPNSGTTDEFCTGGTFAELNADGGFVRPHSLFLDLETQTFYVHDSAGRISKFDMSTNEFLGALGNIEEKNDVNGTCPEEGMAPTWCTGGKFEGGFENGAWAWTWGVVAFDTDSGYFYVGDAGNSRVSKFEIDSGAYLGSLGVPDEVEEGSKCAEGVAATDWCTGVKDYDYSYASGGFAEPIAITFDHNKDLLVLEEVRVQRVKLPENRQSND